MGRAATGPICSSPGVSVGETQIQTQRKPGRDALKGRESRAKTGVPLRGQQTPRAEAAVEITSPTPGPLLEVREEGG